ncbi:hypothetical protein [Arcanobacterium hippocoleae]|uniref:hypothetical protein n=1 Tax=Arcanobacterium hippocoleae TaxID=149017 RepID=UPI003341BEBF
MKNRRIRQKLVVSLAALGLLFPSILISGDANSAIAAPNDANSALDRTNRAAGETRALADDRAAGNPLAGDYIVGGKDDPWPRDVNKPFDTNTVDPQQKLKRCQRSKIALMFDFAPEYVWETMGGIFNEKRNSNVVQVPRDLNPNLQIPSTKDVRDVINRYGNVNQLQATTFIGTNGRQQTQKIVRRTDQADQILDIVDKVAGAPVDLGIYTFDKFKQTGWVDGSNRIHGGHASGNTPDMPATPLDTPEGYETIVNKIKSLDATENGKRRTGKGGSNWDMAIRKVLQDTYDMVDRGETPYSDIFLYGPFWPNLKGPNDLPVNETIVLEQLNRYFKELSLLGTDIHFVAVGPVGKGSQWKLEKAFANLERRIDEHGTTVKITNADGIALPNSGNDHNGTSSDGIIFLTHNPGGYGIADTFDNIGDWHSENAMITGKFSETIGDLFYQSPCISVRSEKVDGEFNHLGPREGATVKFDVSGINQGINTTFTTNKFGAAEFPTMEAAGQSGHLIDNFNFLGMKQLDPTNPQRDFLTTPFNAKYKGKAPLRCIGYSRNKKPQDITNLVVKAMGKNEQGLNVGANGQGITVGASFAHLAKNPDYTYVKCAFYSRPIEEIKFTKHADVAPSALGYDISGAEFKVGYTCKDPLDNNHVYREYDPNTGKSTKDNYNRNGGLNDEQKLPNPANFKIHTKVQDELEIPLYPFVKRQNTAGQPQSIETQYLTGRDKVITRAPLGTVCNFSEQVKLPPKFDWDGFRYKAADWDTDTNHEEGVYDKPELLASVPADNLFDTNTNYQAITGAKITKKATGKSKSIANPSKYESSVMSTSGNQAVIRSHTEYRAQKSAITARVKVDLPAALQNAQLPDQIAVGLKCRYMPDPANPPESLRGTLDYPGTGDLADSIVPLKLVKNSAGKTDGYLVISDSNKNKFFSVGTHCFVQADTKDIQALADAGVARPQSAGGETSQRWMNGFLRIIRDGRYQI